MNKICIELSKNSLDNIEKFIKHGEWSELCKAHKIKTNNWEIDLYTHDVKELLEVGCIMPEIYLSIRSDKGQVCLRVEWYADSTNMVEFVLQNVRDIFRIEINDLWNDYDCIIFKETHDGIDISKSLGTNIREIHFIDEDEDDDLTAELGL